MDPDSSILAPLAAFFVLVFLGGLFSAAEASIVALNDGNIRRLASEGDKGAKRIVALTQKPQNFLTTVQAGKTICEMLAIAAITHTLTLMALRYLFVAGDTPSFAYPLTLAAVTLLLAFVILTLGNLLPKRLASYFPERIASALAPLISFFAVILKPMVILLNGATGLCLRLLGQNPDREPESVTEEEIRMMVTVGEEKGTIEQSEKDMINNIFEFDDKVVTEVMTHRMELSALKDNCSLEEAVAMARKSGYSRIPVYHDDIDNIIGMLYVKDLLGFISSDKEFVLSEILHEPFYIPETARCTELFKTFKQKQTHMAVVIDEYGGTYGIVTMEDLLETIVGNIQDEYDNEVCEYMKISDDEYVIDGWLSVDEVEELLEIHVPEETEYDTIGGVVVDMLDDIPDENQHPTVQIGHVLFTVLEVDDRRISKLSAKFLPHQSENS